MRYDALDLQSESGELHAQGRRALILRTRRDLDNARKKKYARKRREHGIVRLAIEEGLRL